MPPEHFDSLSSHPCYHNHDDSLFILTAVDTLVMKYSAASLASLIAGISYAVFVSKVQGFSPAISARTATRPAVIGSSLHAPGCDCPACTGSISQPWACARKRSGCSCPACIGGLTALSALPTTRNFEEQLSSSLSRKSTCAPGCNCPSCTNNSSFRPSTRLSAVRNGEGQLSSSPFPRKSVCAPGCNCPLCTNNSSFRSATRLFADAAEEAEAVDETNAAEETVEAAVDIPQEVLAMDGVESNDEAHNVDRPERKSLQKKKRQEGTPLSEYTIGTMHKATVKSVASYGAFCDFGASSDGLLHISRMSKEYVSDVSSIVSVGDEIEVRLLEINTEKNQVALSLLTEDEEGEMKQGIQDRKGGQSKRGRKPDREQTNALLAQVREKGYDSNLWFDGVVVSTPSFGAFVQVNAKDIHDELEGSFDGLVHIGSLTDGRANFVEEYASMNDSVKVRIKNIGEDGKVALTMTSVEYEEEQAARNKKYSSDRAEEMGDPNWRESLKDFEAENAGFESKLMINWTKSQRINTRGKRDY